MKKGILYSIMTVGLVLGLILPMPVLVYAADVGLTKGVTPATPNEYQLGDTIHYTMSIINWSSVENVTVEAVWDVLPDGSTVYPTGPVLPYTLTPGQSQAYTYDWVATRTGTVTNTFHASGYQISTFNAPFSMYVQKSSTVIAGAPTPDWREDIQPGDILYDVDSTWHSEIGDFSTFIIGHIGMYIGDLELGGQILHNRIIEADGTDGVHLDDIQSWDYPNRRNVYLLRVNCSEPIKSAAIEFAKGQLELGKPYDYLWIQKSSDPNSPSWYCSELVWAAYFNQGVNLQHIPHPGPVTPVEIFADDDVSVVDCHLAEEFPDDFWAIAFCPVDLMISDRDGHVISKEACGIPGALYIEDDLNGDGSPDDLIYIPERQTGDYLINVIAESGASPTDTYSLEISGNGTTIVLAENTTVAHTPSGGYIIRSTETEIRQIIPATIDIDPDALNLRSTDKYVTVYIELPLGYDVSKINIPTIRLNGIVPALTNPTKIGDYDRDRVRDLMVKFDAPAVKSLLTPGNQVEITITGEVAGIAFEGDDIIRVISP